MKRLFSIIAAALVLTGICASAQDDPLGRCLLLNERGSILMDEGRFPEAADAYRKALSLYPAWADSVGRIIIMHNFVDALSSQGAISEAVRVLDALEGVSLEGEQAWRCRISVQIRWPCLVEKRKRCRYGRAF